MALSRNRRSTTYGEFWPGYVDVLSTLLLVVTFLMSVFMVSQFYVSQEAAGKDTALRRLTRQIAEITNLLSLEKGKSKSIEDELASLQASLATLRADNERLGGLAGLSGDKDARIAALDRQRAQADAEIGDGAVHLVDGLVELVAGEIGGVGDAGSQLRDTRQPFLQLIVETAVSMARLQLQEAQHQRAAKPQQ